MAQYQSMSLRNIQCVVLSLTLAVSANATSSSTGVTAAPGTTFNPLEHVEKSGVSQVSLNGAQLLDTLLAEVSSDGTPETSYFNSPAVVAYDKIARSWPAAEEAPVPPPVRDAKPKASASLKTRHTSEFIAY